MKTNLHINLSLLGLTLFIFLSVNSFCQINWEKYENNPVLEDETNSWYQMVYHPVVIHEENTFKMWFCGWHSGIYEIGHATSPDGINWVVWPVPVIPVGQPDDWDRYKFPSTVIWINDTLKMWYTGSLNLIDDLSIGYAWSVDEYNWNIYPEPVLEKGENGSWDDSWVYAPRVLYDGIQYHMWYSASGDDWHDDIGYATSVDGIGWDKDYENSPVIELGDTGTFYDEWLHAGPVIKHNDYYQMWFGGFDGTNYNPEQYIRVGYASSSDGINWTIENNKDPVMDVGEPGSWDDRIVHMPSVLIHNNRYKMWYGGVGTFFKVGYALGDSVTITSLSEKSNSILEILNVYPCPFTSSTTIYYQLLDSSPVTLEIYNNYGQVVSTLVNNEVKIQGKYKVSFNSMGLNPGIYFCVLKTSEGMQTKKIIKL